MRRFGFLVLMMALILVNLPLHAVAAYFNNETVTMQEKKANKDSVLQARLDLFQRFEAAYQVPWIYLAAIDQYERTMKKRKKNSKEKPDNRLTAITIPPRVWSGYLNPEEDDTDPGSIQFFGGIGKDGSGDGAADQTNDMDVLYTTIQFLKEFGMSPEDFRIGLWNFYRRDQAVRTIQHFVRVYDKYQNLDLLHHAFPIPRRYEYSYKNTWGDARGWGGRRIHEGTDIFADYGTPVLSTSYGVIEIMGWNRFGGWRVGIRDIENVYHYFAHLSAFNKGLKVGDIVEPGQVVGYVGSSGYGKPGTSGKFPPHLHYGMYSETGSDEWAFDPFPYLKRWERQSKKRK